MDADFFIKLFVGFIDFLSHALLFVRHLVFPKLSSLKGWSVVVTGASSGMGRSIALSLAKLGVRVYAVDIQEGGLDSLKYEVKRLGFNGFVVPLVCDLRMLSQIKDIVRKIELDLKTNSRKQLNGFVSVAGVPTLSPLVAESTNIEDEYDWVMDVNVRAPMRLSQLLFPLLLRSTKSRNEALSRLVYVTSGSSFSRFPYMGVYGMSKGALEIYADTLRREVAPWGVQVSCVVPTAVLTPMWDQLGATNGKGIEPHLSTMFGPHIAQSLQFFRNMRPWAVSPKLVAEKVITALRTRHPLPRYIVDKSPLLTWCSWQLPDWVADWFLLRLIFGRNHVMQVDYEPFSSRIIS